LRDRLTRTTTCVNVASDGQFGNRPGPVPISDTGIAISADGRFVIFESNSSNLVPNDTNETIDVFVYDRLSRKITRVSVASDGAEANGTSTTVEFSGTGNFIGGNQNDGRFVVFTSDATNLVPRTTAPSHSQVYFA